MGKFIRAVRIDELPQLINILKGEMSFIGPRPERPEIIAQYMEEMPEFAFRMKVKAGLAGYAQVYGKYNTTPYDKLEAGSDLYRKLYCMAGYQADAAYAEDPFQGGKHRGCGIHTDHGDKVGIR